MFADGFMPHGMCFLWQTDVLTLHVISDALIALAYFSIPLVLALLVRRRPDLPFIGALRMFCAFIIACGLTHAMAIVVIWFPLYWLEGWIKAATAALSIATVFVIVPLLPRLLAMRSPAELERLNARLMETAGAAAKANRRLAEQTMVLVADSTTDALTGIMNRRGFETQLNEALGDARRSSGITSLLMIDVDDFKAYNDTFGHQAGDVCLRATAQAIKDACMRPRDAVARFGGEEFAVIMEHTDADGAGFLGERIRAAVAALAIEHGSTAHYPIVTVSVGVGTVAAAGEGSNDALVLKADQALYRAKASGRNCVMVEASA